MTGLSYSLLLFAALCVSGVSSCTHTQVRTHTLTDAVGKHCYRGMDEYGEMEIYRRNGVYYCRNVFYKIPAGSELYNYCILSKHSSVTHVGRRDIPDYKEGMELRYVYYALDKITLRRLLPGCKYKEPADGEGVLPQSAFEGMKPVATITDARKLKSVLTSTYSELLPCERSAVNYILMPLTGTLYVTDAVLSVGITTAIWLGYNIPLGVGMIVYGVCKDI